jgi:hypothetical protein
LASRREHTRKPPKNDGRLEAKNCAERPVNVCNFSQR